MNGKKTGALRTFVSHQVFIMHSRFHYSIIKPLQSVSRRILLKQCSFTPTPLTYSEHATYNNDEGSNRGRGPVNWRAVTLLQKRDAYCRYQQKRSGWRLERIHICMLIYRIKRSTAVAERLRRPPPPHQKKKLVTSKPCTFAVRGGMGLSPSVAIF